MDVASFLLCNAGYGTPSLQFSALPYPSTAFHAAVMLLPCVGHPGGPDHPQSPIHASEEMPAMAVLHLTHLHQPYLRPGW